ncbi:MAG: Fe-S cluster assembly protein SufD [Gammaproteobacteria bacterium]|nr:Fe-S cluster assembly protein SufD [Chromatiales bacterium]MDP6674057.1 Fe-S cluster assembly protein SufD [Gammaproteobacteria bacterium]
MKKIIQDRDTRSAAALTTIEAAFEKLQAEPAAGTPAWLQPAREMAFANLRDAGFPRVKDEDWKYTNLTGFAERSAAYLENQPLAVKDKTATVLLGDLPILENQIRIVFVNGLYRPDLSIAVQPDFDLELTPYSTADSSTGKNILHQQPIDHNVMIALNTAFLADGLAVRVADNKKVGKPIHVIFIADGQPCAAQPRLSINVGRNAHALVVQHHISMGESLTNAVTTINCAEQSQLLFVRLQNESEQSMHVANQVVRVAADSLFNSISIDFGSQLARNDLVVDLCGERAQANLYGLFMTNGQRHVDNHLRVDHHAAHTTSQEIYRGILNDKARGVFNGKIIVHTGADGTDAQMSNRNLLLSEQAEIDTKPELEIYTDDIKCAHGATTGQLDMNSMFYLRARGIPEASARMMLVSAFAQEIIDHIRSASPALADYLSTQMSKQLPDIT